MCIDLHVLQPMKFTYIYYLIQKTQQTMPKNVLVHGKFGVISCQNSRDYIMRAKLHHTVHCVQFVVKGHSLMCTDVWTVTHVQKQSSVLHVCTQPTNMPSCTSQRDGWYNFQFILPLLLNCSCYIHYIASYSQLLVYLSGAGYHFNLSCK